jgi:hypothetical protein
MNMRIIIRKDGAVVMTINMDSLTESQINILYNNQSGQNVDTRISTYTFQNWVEFNYVMNQVVNIV